jgi:hypothetical protein
MTPSQSRNGARRSFDKIVELHALLERGSSSSDLPHDVVLDENLHLVWVQQSDPSARGAPPDLPVHPASRGQFLEFVWLPKTSVGLAYFGSLYSLQQYLEIAREISETLRDLRAPEGPPPEEPEHPGTVHRLARKDLRVRSRTGRRSYRLAMARATANDPNLVPHYWPFYMQRWAGRLLDREPHLLTRRSWPAGGVPEGPGLTILEYNLFHASSLILNRVTRELLGYYVDLPGPTRMVVSADPDDARRVADSVRAAATAAGRIRDREETWGDRFGQPERLWAAYEPLWQLAQILDGLGMRFARHENRFLLELGPWARLGTPDRDPALRLVYSDLYKVMSPFAERGTTPDLDPRSAVRLFELADRLEQSVGPSACAPPALPEAEVQDAGGSGPRVEAPEWVPEERLLRYGPSLEKKFR